MAVTQARMPMILDQVQAVRVDRLSPSFVRVELGGPCLADFGVDGPLYDQRIKLIFPHGAGRLPSFTGAEESWYAAWLDRPVEERGHLRTALRRALVTDLGLDRRQVAFMGYWRRGVAMRS
ncbi:MULTISPECIES: siderophore-interacting protein [unclassified Nocardioides]|uniref:siderophore-interacting protein n=1 Tax=unclassified Nocardioides TaxID=2615069 RepID=UPI0000570B1A|nr:MULTISPECIES: siderophore-interacting protein [unclassified Nocardioides]ABL83908.1 FAD-binding 9, siderophore-interacting domain protein [Nocardioides sp. JS614]